MTIKECIDIVDDLKPNQYSTKIKVMWLSFVDETIINDVLKTHQGYDGRYDDFTGYTEDKLSVPLIVSSPYDRLYTEYLKMKIDAENGETARYNNSAALFNSYMMEYRKFYNKTHLPLSESEIRAIKPSNKGNSGISEAELENLKRELYAKLSEEFSGMVSNDKLYDIVTNYVYNNLEMIRANDGLTPFINENGNWQIGGNDTGVKASSLTIFKGTLVESGYSDFGAGVFYQNRFIPEGELEGIKVGDIYINTNTHWIFLVTKIDDEGIGFDALFTMPDYQYDFKSHNAQSGHAVAEAIEQSLGEVNKVLALLVDV